MVDVVAILIYRCFQNQSSQETQKGSQAGKGSQATNPVSQGISSPGRVASHSTRHRVLQHTLSNGWCSLNSRRLLICYLLRYSEHRFKLHLLQQPKETVRLKKKKKGETPLCVEGAWPSQSSRAGTGSCLTAPARAGWRP